MSTADRGKRVENLSFSKSFSYIFQWSGSPVALRCMCFIREENNFNVDLLLFLDPRKTKGKRLIFIAGGWKSEKVSRFRLRWNLSFWWTFDLSRGYFRLKNLNTIYMYYFFNWLRKQLKNIKLVFSYFWVFLGN